MTATTVRGLGEKIPVIVCVLTWNCPPKLDSRDTEGRAGRPQLGEHENRQDSQGGQWGLGNPDKPSI
jgi:hypothetical protein